MTGPEKFLVVENAGLAMVGPFLPHLFSKLNFLETSDEGRQRFRDDEAFSRAVHLTQSLVDGRSDHAEPMLSLNKIMCGSQPSRPVASSIVRTDAEIELCDQLLAAMLANWPALAQGTSIAGLQETFLQRPGQLSFDGSGWQLNVERKTLDVLMDQITWGFRTLHLPWQADPLHTNW